MKKKKLNLFKWFEDLWMGGEEEEGYFCTVVFFFIAKGTKMSLKFLTGIFPAPDTRLFPFLPVGWMMKAFYVWLLPGFLYFKSVCILSFWVETGTRG